MKQQSEHYYEADVYARLEYHRRSHGNALREYRRRKLRQQRLTLLALLLLALVACLGAAAWWLMPRGLSLLPEELPLLPRNVDTAEIAQLIDDRFGIDAPTSLLYYNGHDYAMQKGRLGAGMSGKLLPMITTREDLALKAELQALINSFPPGHFTPFLYYYNPHDGSYVEINGYAPVKAASVIKLPVLYNYLLELDEQVMTMETPLLYLEYHRGGGAGELQYKPAGVLLPAYDVARDMIRISDNTSTNVMIGNLGGSSVVNRTFADLGLRYTRIHNWLPDLEGTNKISAYEMATILHNIDQGMVISQYARHVGLDILQQTRNNRLLPWLLPRDVKVAHKTGDIGTALGDSGIFYLPDGTRYILSIQVERPHNDYTAKEMMQQASLMIYNRTREKLARLEEAAGENEQAVAEQPVAL